MAEVPAPSRAGEGKATASGKQPPGASLRWIFFLLVLALGVLLGRAFLPGETLFSNDGPLGRLMSECHRLPGAFTGVWQDLNLVGFREQGALPNLSAALRWLLQPVFFSKLYAFLALLLLGLAAWFCFREWGLSAPACLLGGLAAALNSTFFSIACWGVAAQPLALAATFLALAALAKNNSWRGWLRAALAGFAVGLGVSEAADVGVIFSVFVAVYVLYQAIITPGPRVGELVRGGGRLVLITSLALLVAAQAISALVETQVEGVSVTQTSSTTPQQRWDWATKWSLPKSETLGIIVPGLFGFRLDTPNGGRYWGDIGRDAAWDEYFAEGSAKIKPVETLRFTGSGNYAGVVVVLVGLWAAARSLRRKDTVFDPVQRRRLWFWSGTAVISLALGFGHYAPFYALVYHLPYASNIRNPVKFLDLTGLALVVLFAYGADGLWRSYLRAAATARAQKAARNSAWWHRLETFDQRWMAGLLAAFGISLLGWIIYAKSQPALVRHLVAVLFAPDEADRIAAFSVAQVGWFVLLFALAVVLLGLILAGNFRGPGSRLGIWLLGGLLVLDLLVANQPWPVFWNYPDKYASNPVIDRLRQTSHEQRVTLVPGAATTGGFFLNALYSDVWLQHHFPWYNIQSLDVSQMPRKPEDLQAFQNALLFDGSNTNLWRLVRRWQLTNTRLLVGDVQMLVFLNQQIDPLKNPLQIVTRFGIVPRPGVDNPRSAEDLVAESDPAGAFAVFEYNGALPRARLFNQWLLAANDQAALDIIADHDFDPSDKVVVTGDASLPRVAAVTNSNTGPGTVAITSYASRRVLLQAHSEVPSVLLLNDRFDPNWQVGVDGRPAKLLRCNFLMRGVHLEPGDHRVEFDFQPSTRALKISLAALGVGVVLLAVLCLTGRPRGFEAAAPAAAAAATVAMPVLVEASKNNGQPARRPAVDPQRRIQSKPAGKK